MSSGCCMLSLHQVPQHTPVVGCIDAASISKLQAARHLTCRGLSSLKGGLGSLSGGVRQRQVAEIRMLSGHPQLHDAAAKGSDNMAYSSESTIILSKAVQQDQARQYSQAKQDRKTTCMQRSWPCGAGWLLPVITAATCELYSVWTRSLLSPKQVMLEAVAVPGCWLPSALQPRCPLSCWINHCQVSKGTAG